VKSSTHDFEDFIFPYGVDKIFENVADVRNWYYGIRMRFQIFLEAVKQPPLT
jgi:hypothetical protein